MMPGVLCFRKTHMEEFRICFQLHFFHVRLSLTGGGSLMIKQLAIEVCTPEPEVLSEGLNTQCKAFKPNLTFDFS